MRGKYQTLGLKPLWPLLVAKAIMRAQLFSLLAMATVAHAGDSFVSLAEGMRRTEMLKYALVAGSAISTPPPRQALSFVHTRFPWKLSITATCFWAGESAASGGGVSNYQSAYDPLFAIHAPRQNPFYVALPVVDIRDGHTLPEAARIPWLSATFVRDGQSVLKDHWVAVRHGGKVAYCQLEDAGPWKTDSWGYCFGPDRPSPNRNGNAGIDVSPAVRDYLGMSGMDTVDWRWCDEREVPRQWMMPAGKSALAFRTTKQ
jgi:hypothetical protein